MKFLYPRWFGCASILIAASLAPATIQAAPFPSPADWRNENIYQIFTDRFYDGDPSNDNIESGRNSPYDPASPTGIHGGDFKGIQQKLDYIKSLGATAIWISPIPLNVGGNSAYHGYGAQDFYTLAPHWGTMTDLSNMVAAAHARGIKVILDVVVNHSGDLLSSSDAGYPTFVPPPGGYVLQYTNPNQQHAPPFNITNATPPAFTSIFHTNGVIQSFSTTQEVVLGELDGLDDFATETTYVRTNMMNIYTNWVGRADFDGFRIDTAKHVDYGFWQYWCPQLHQFAASIGKSNLFMFGEAFDSNEALVGSYTGTEGGGPPKLDSMLDYPLYDTVNSVFATASGNTLQIQNHYNAITANYDSNAWYRLVTFLDNHDNPRFLNVAADNTNRLNVALEFLYTSRGVPCLYYGTEQAFDGADDPNNREDMFAGQFEQGPSIGDNFDEAHPLFQLVAKLNNFRRLYPALRTGVHNNLWSSSSGPGLFAYSRVLSNQEVFVCFNTAASSQPLTSLPTTYAVGTVLVNLLNTNDTIVVTAGSGTNTIPGMTVPGTIAKIYIAQSLVLPLDPVVVSQSPAHAAGCISTSSPIVLQFSKPMNTNSVQTAFSVTPATTGTFTWNAVQDTMTFTPGPAWHTFTTNLIHLATNAVDGVNGNSLYAPFDTYFVTFTTNAITTSSSPAGAGTTSGGGTVNCGSNVTVCATPSACYSFVYWTRNGRLASTSACYTFSATGNEAMVANFVSGHGSLAIDNAADPSYSVVQFVWSSGSNGGTGFDPWVLAGTYSDNHCNGFFSNTSTNSNSPPHAPPGIDTDGKAWGIYANSVNCGPAMATAYRAFAIGSLQVGGQLLIDMSNGLNDMAGAVVGFALRNSDATNSPTDYTTGARFQFYLAGGSNDYTVTDAAGAYDSGVPLTYSGLHLIFNLGTNDSYTLAIISNGTGLTNLINGTLGGTPGSTLDSIALFNNDNGAGPPHDVFFNSLSVANLTSITDTITTSSSPANGGTTTGGGTYNCGASVTVIATPSAGYNFANWTEGGTNVSTSANYAFTASANRALVANFTLQSTPFQVWQLQYFGCTNCPQAAASADPDSDGYNNLQEFFSGANPTNPASHPTGFPPYLLGWWKFDEGMGTAVGDSSSNNNTGAIVDTGGPITWTSGMFGSALSFDGETQVIVSNSPSLNPSNAITVSAWVNAQIWFNTPRILEKGRSDNQYGLLINPSGQLEFLLSGVTNGVLVTTPPSEEIWHHIAGTYNGTSMALYVDGQLAAQQPASGALTTSTDMLNIGSKPSGNLFDNFNGDIDDVRVYGQALSAAEITLLYNRDTVGDGIPNWWREEYFGISSVTNAISCATCDPDGDGYNNLQEFLSGTDPTDSNSYPTNIPPNLVGWWKLDEQSGLIVSDSSENNNTGTLTLGDGDWTSGLINGALFFDGESTQVFVTNSPSLNPATGITIVAWVDAGDWFTNARILEKGKSDNQYGLLINGAGQLEFLLAGITNGTLSTTPPSTGSWHHLTATYNGALITFYIDGQQAAQQSASGPLATTTDPLAIGGKPSGGPVFAFYGIIDDVRIYGAALSASQISQLYNTDSVGDGIANWWRQQYFGNSSATGVTTCATCDFDNTGQNNLFKFVTGLDPTDRVSVFSLNITGVAGQLNQKNLVFSPVFADRTYTPFFNTNLHVGNWQTLTGTTESDLGNQRTITDQNATQGDKFYIIQITLP